MHLNTSPTFNARKIKKYCALGTKFWQLEDILKGLVSISIIILFGILSFAQLPDKNDLNAIRKEIVDTARDTSRYGAAEALDEIKSNLVKLEKLRMKIKQSNNINNMVDEVADSLKEMAQSYSKIASMKHEVLGFFESGELKLKNSDGEIFTKINDIREMIARKKADIKKFEQQLEHETNETERKIIKASIEGGNRVVNNLNAHLIMWEKFQSAQKPLVRKLNISKEKIRYFMHILDVNAEVYESAASAAQLNSSMRGALKDLSALEGLDGVIEDLQSSWIDVSTIVDQITETDFETTLEGF